jgi:hypothetical protein
VEAFLTELAKTIATLGPVGAFIILAWYLWLHYGQKPLMGTTTTTTTSSKNGNGGYVALDVLTAHIQSIPKQTASIMTEQVQETRDCVRDTAAAIARVEKMQDRELEHLTALVMAQARTAEILERVEKRMNEHDRWEHERDRTRNL